MASRTSGVGQDVGLSQLSLRAHDVVARDFTLDFPGVKMSMTTYPDVLPTRSPPTL